MDMDLTLSHVFIEVLDQDEALTFYRDVLGMELRVDAQLGDGIRWLTMGLRNQPELEIALVSPDMARSPADAATVRELIAKGTMLGVIFATKEVDAVFESVRKAGADVMQEPIDQPYGVRDCAFRDPFGNHIRFSQQLDRT
jgi:uncharacterized glyoxalase superfamily protein PhnB